MTEVYIRDEEIPKNNPKSITRRSKDEINLILSGFIPTPPKTFTPTNLGFYIHYENELDANYVFNPVIIQKLKDAKLTASFPEKTQHQREIYIPNVPDNIYQESDSNITVEIEQQNRIDLLHLNKFQSDKTQKKYIKLTLRTIS